MANPSDSFYLQSERHREGAANVAGDGAHQRWLFKRIPARVAGQICRINLVAALSRRAL